MKIKRFFALLSAMFLLTGCTADSGGQNNGSTQVENGADATEEAANAAEEPYVLSFTATTTDGESVTSDMLTESKLTMINVWATYCNPCLSEMPDLGAIAAAYDKAEFQMFGIVSDVTEESDTADIEYAKELITGTGADYPHLLLNESLYANLVAAVEAVPTTFFVNSEGELLGYVVGSQPKEAWEEIINDLLEEIEQ